MVLVLHILEAVRGGTSRHVLDIVRHAQGIRHEVVVPPATLHAQQSGAQYDQGAIEAMRDAGAVIHYIPMRRLPPHPSNGAAIVRIRRLLEKRDPDVLHGHSSIGGALARLAGWSSAVPCAYTPNGLATGRVALAGERALRNRTACFIAVSESEAIRAAELGLVSDDRLLIIPNGIDIDSGSNAPVDLRQRLGLKAETPLVGTIARLVPQKAPDSFVQICALVGHRRRDVHFVLIGMGPLQRLVDREVRRAGLSGRFHQIGHLPNAAGAMEQFDVFVLASRFEGGPYTPLEAMRAGTPVVVSNVVGNRDVVVDGVSGFIAAFGDDDAFADAVLHLLDDVKLRESVRREASERLHELFDVRIMGRKLSRVYQQLAADDRRSTRRLPHPSSSGSTNSPDSSA